MADLKQQIANLTPAQRELLEQRLRGRTARPRGADGIPRSENRSNAPLSFAQRRLWFFDQLAPGSPAYTMSRAYRVAGMIDEDALRRAVTAVGQRHEILRTTFAMEGDQPVQQIAPTPPGGLSVIDLTAVGDRDKESAARAAMADEVRRPFDLERGPLLRVSLIRMGEREHVLMMAMHHIVSDGWSMGILVREL
ncbi:MAG TPA: condensation domain-containing protein, partial [Thermoanaerobaculia bacterium]|nr:condensation domain-containing protein [Thermoanaerobaculia bacterium]